MGTQQPLAVGGGTPPSIEFSREQEVPIGISGGTNFYAYAGNDPVTSERAGAMTDLDVSKLTLVKELEGANWEESEELKLLADQAEAFLKGFHWCGNIVRGYAGPTVPGVVGVFLFRIDPTQDDVDDWLWVIAGDLPPAYLVTDDAKNGLDALELYVELMEEWVDAVRRGQPVDDLIPVNVPPTENNAEMLASRMTFLRERVIPELKLQP